MTEAGKVQKGSHPVQNFLEVFAVRKKPRAPDRQGPALVSQVLWREGRRGPGFLVWRWQ